MPELMITLGVIAAGATLVALGAVGGGCWVASRRDHTIRSQAEALAAGRRVEEALLRRIAELDPDTTTALMDAIQQDAEREPAEAAEAEWRIGTGPTPTTRRGGGRHAR